MRLGSTRKTEYIDDKGEEMRKDEERRKRRDGGEVGSRFREFRPERYRIREERPRARSFHCRNVVDGYGEEKGAIKTARRTKRPIPGYHTPEVEKIRGSGRDLQI